MRTHARHGGLVLIVVIALAIVAGPASAREAYESNVTIRAGDDGAGQEFVKGKVKSRKAKCERRRKVKLYWDEPGLPREFERVRTRFTDARGRWIVFPPGADVPPGRYFAKATGDRRRGDRCKGARSETITVIGS